MKILCVWQVYLNHRCSAARKRCASIVSGKHLKDLAIFSSSWKEFAWQFIWIDEKSNAARCVSTDCFLSCQEHWWWSNRINQTPYKYSCLVWFSLHLSTKLVVFLEDRVCFSELHTHKSYACGSEWDRSRALAKTLVFSTDYFFPPSFWHVLTHIKQGDTGICCGRYRPETANEQYR